MKFTGSELIGLGFKVTNDFDYPMSKAIKLKSGDVSVKLSKDNKFYLFFGEIIFNELDEIQFNCLMKKG